MDSRIDQRRRIELQLLPHLYISNICFAKQSRLLEATFPRVPKLSLASSSNQHPTSPYRYLTLAFLYRSSSPFQNNECRASSSKNMLLSPRHPLGFTILRFAFPASFCLFFFFLGRTWILNNAHTSARTPLTPSGAAADPIPEKLWYKLGPNGLSSELKEYVDTFLGRIQRSNTNL